ncbi:MAG: S8 family serine peptidase, partial [Pseudomonadota bacterium]
DKLIDESTGQYTDVIIQFKSEQDETLSKLLEAAVETERNRAMIVDPSYILPPEARAFDGKKSSRRKLRSQQASLTANIALEASIAGLIAATAVPSIVAPKIADFLRSSNVESAVSAIKSRLKGKARMADPTPLPNIGGARVMVNRGDLKKIVVEGQDTIEGVYENAQIKAPRVIETSATSQSATVGAYSGTTWGLEQAKALSAWSAFDTKGRMSNGDRVRVAVLDTGVDPTHPDISPRLVDFAEFDQAGQMASQGVNNARDSGRHGTHVAGTVVGGNASGGWVGMAPDAELIAGLVLDGDNGGTLAQVIGGIDWAVGQGSHVVNLSLGGLTFSQSVGTPYQRAIVNALVRGTLVVAAIGNDGHQTSGAPGNDYFSLAVGAHDVTGRCAGFSAGRTLELNQSNFIDERFLPLVYTKPDLSAPGVAVKSSVPGAKWAHLNGTSMATPHVSGAAALLFAATDLSNHSISERAFVARDLMLGGVSDAGEAGQDQRFGFGALNVLKSIDEARERGF